MRPLLLFPAAVLGYVLGMSIGVHGQSALRGQLNTSNRQFNDLTDSFVRLEKANNSTVAAYKELEDVNHKNEENVRQCLAGWHVAIDDLNKSAAFTRALAAAERK